MHAPTEPPRLLSTVPPRHHERRFAAWCRWMSIYNKTRVSAKARPPMGLMTARP